MFYFFNAQFFDLTAGRDDLPIRRKSNITKKRTKSTKFNGVGEKQTFHEKVQKFDFFFGFHKHDEK